MTNQPYKAIQPTIGMMPIRPWTIILPNHPGSWNGQPNASPTLVTARSVNPIGELWKPSLEASLQERCQIRPAIELVPDAFRPRRRLAAHHLRSQPIVETRRGDIPLHHPQAHGVVAARSDACGRLSHEQRADARTPGFAEHVQRFQPRVWLAVE